MRCNFGTFNEHASQMQSGNKWLGDEAPDDLFFFGGGGGVVGQNTPGREGHFPGIIHEMKHVIAQPTIWVCSFVQVVLDVQKIQLAKVT